MGNLSPVVDKPGASSMPYVPGIDGLRALAIVAVVLFHLGAPWMPGGFLGVSLFFTLSGYLITSLVLVEHRTTLTFSLRRFWGRRFRRLMPAALVVLAAIAICGITGVFEGERLRGDILWAVGYLSNWRSASAPTSYADLFNADTSPLIHFWSLAIEEQFYVVFPVLMWVLLRRRWLIAPVFSILAVASVVSMIATSSRNLAYYATHARVAELAVGVLFALVFPIGREVGRKAAATWSVAGMSGFAVFGVLCVRVTTSDSYVYNGLLPAFALVSTTMIAAVLVNGPMKMVLSWRPFVEIGRISYPLYLFHWPVIVALDEDRMGFGGLGLALVRVAVTVVLAVTTMNLIESPIRGRRLFTSRRTASIAIVAALMVTIAVAVAVPSNGRDALAGVEAPDEVVDFDQARGTSTSGEPTEASVSPGVDARTPIVVLGSEPRLVGDVGAAVDGVGDLAYEIVDSTQPLCPVRLSTPPGSDCESFAAVARRSIAATGAEVVLIGVGESERSLLNEFVQVDAQQPDNSLPDDFLLINEVKEIVAQLLIPLEGLRVVVVDYVGGDTLWAGIDDADLRFEQLVALDGSTDDFATSLIDEVRRIEDATIDQRVRVMLIGDSTSFGIAQAIHDVAGERYRVLWAGGRNCPLVAVDQVRWWEGAEFDMGYCPDLDSTWRGMITDFRPDLVIEVASIPEQTEQKYPGDDTWYTIEDQEFVNRHDVAMTELMSLVDSVGATMVFFDSPSVSGEGLGGAQFARPERILAWNAMLAGWEVRWPQIRNIPWAAIINEVETVPGELRGDDVHMEQDVLNEVFASHVMPLLDAIAAEAKAD